MLVFPAWTDQFGNAARVVARNAGMRGNILDVTPAQMIEMVEHVLTDETIRSAVRDLRLKCNSEDEIQGLVDFVGCHTALAL